MPPTMCSVTWAPVRALARAEFIRNRGRLPLLLGPVPVLSRGVFDSGTEVLSPDRYGRVSKNVYVWRLMALTSRVQRGGPAFQGLASGSGNSVRYGLAEARGAPGASADEMVERLKRAIGPRSRVG